MPRVSANERAETRTRLIEAGKREFAQRGLAGARFDEISLAAGHAKGTIYNYFDSKEDLFFTIVGQWCTQLVDVYDAQPASPSPAKSLRLVAELDIVIAAEDPDLARMVVQHMPALDHSHHRAVEAAITPGIALLEQILGDGQRRNEFHLTHHPRTVARLFLGVLSAYEIEALSPSSDLRLGDIPDLVHHHFIKPLAKEPSHA